MPLAKQLPGLQRYATVVPNDPEDCTYDSVAILEFESLKAFDKAFDSDQGQRTVDDLDNFVEDVVRVVGSETVHLE